MSLVAQSHSGPLVTPWLVVPMAVMTLLLLAAHLTAIQRSGMPESRRRIRTANGLLMMLVTPLAAYAFSLVTPADPRTFVLSFSIVVLLLGLILSLAVLDAINNLRLGRQARRELEVELRRLRAGPPSVPDESRGV